MNYKILIAYFLRLLRQSYTLVRYTIGLLVVANIFTLSEASSDELAESLMRQYEEIILAGKSDEEIEKPLSVLLTKAEEFVGADPEEAGLWIAMARIRFGYANTQGPIRGMRLITDTRKELEQSINLDPNMMGGYALGFLGYLYAVMPSWPLSFGDMGKSKAILDQALVIDKGSVSNLYFYATYLYLDKDYGAAKDYLDLAENIAHKMGVDGFSNFYLSSINDLRSEISKK